MTKTIFELIMGKDLFMEMPLDRLRISEDDVNMMNKLWPGKGLFITGDHPTGHIALSFLESDYDNARMKETNYYIPSSGGEVVKLYVIMDIMETLPITTTVSGRGKKFYNDFLYSIVLGDKFTMPKGYTFLDHLYRGTSIDVRYLKKTEIEETRALMDAYQKFLEFKTP